MVRGVQLSSLLAQLRAETGRVQSVSVGTSEADNLKHTLRRVQRQLYIKYDWSHMRVQRTIQLSAGQRYYDFPADLDFDNIESVKLEYNGIYIPLERGINIDDYSAFDSNAAVPDRSNPTQKWDVRDTGSGEQLEAWPIPSDNSQKIYLTGTKNLAPLVQESDRCDLDEDLIVLYAAAEILARQKSADAQAKLEMANNHLMDLMKRGKAGSKTIQVGLGQNRGRETSNRLSITVS